MSLNLVRPRICKHCHRHVECVHQRLQKARSRSAVQGDGQAGRISCPASVKGSIFFSVEIPVTTDPPLFIVPVHFHLAR